MRFCRCRDLGCGDVCRMPTRAAAAAEVGDESVTQMLGGEIVQGVVVTRLRVIAATSCP
jgi:hypothetical protein